MATNSNSPELPDRSHETVRKASLFRAANPALVTMLVSFLAITLLTGGLTIFALVPSAGESSPVLVAFGSMSPKLLASVAGVLAVGWAISGFARERRWLQAIVCTVVFLASAWLFAMLALSVFLAGLKH